LNLKPAKSSRGHTWFDALAGQAYSLDTGLLSVRVADVALNTEITRFIAVVPDSDNRFARARSGEVGVDEGWQLALQVRQAISADRECRRRPIIAIVDVASQAYGRNEEMLGIHLACAAAADAYASARLAGHPVIAFLVGKAMSGAFLAHGYQANRIIALDSPEVQVQAMSKESAARVTRRSVSDLERLGGEIVPMGYDIESFARLGLLHTIIRHINADRPTTDDVARVRGALTDAIGDARTGAANLSSRLASKEARQTRAASLEVRRRLAEQWDAA
jgi:malonate decarboxylase gamma subunit